MLPATFQVELIEQSDSAKRKIGPGRPISADFCSSAFLEKNLPPLTVMPDLCPFFLAAHTHEQKLFNCLQD